MRNIWLLGLLLWGTGVWAGTSHTVSFLQNQTEVAVTTASAQVLANNPNRNYILVVNKGFATVLLKYITVHAGTEGIPIPAQGHYETYHPMAEAIFLMSTAGTNTVQLIEGAVR
jgi:hypothetical protein